MDDLHRIYGELPADPDAMAISAETSTPDYPEYISQLETAPYTIDEAIADSIEQLTGESFPDPFTGDHDIQYWIWTAGRLVPASPEAAERLRQQELLEREELQCLREYQRAERQRRQDIIVNLACRLVAPLRRLVKRWRGVEPVTRQNSGVID